MPVYLMVILQFQLDFVESNISTRNDPFGWISVCFCASVYETFYIMDIQQHLYEQKYKNDNTYCIEHLLAQKQSVASHACSLVSHGHPMFAKEYYCWDYKHPVHTKSIRSGIQVLQSGFGIISHQHHICNSHICNSLIL